MAFDKTGKYHMSPHHAKMADGAPPRKPQSEGLPKEEATEPKDAAESEGDVPKMLEDLHAKHGGSHMHIHKHEAGVTTHHIGEDGAVEGPHEHADTAAAADHMHAVMNDGGGMEQAMPAGGGQHAMMSGY